TVFTRARRRSGSTGSRFSSRTSRSVEALDRRRERRSRSRSAPGFTRRASPGSWQTPQRDGKGMRFRTVQPRSETTSDRRALTRLYRWAFLVRVLVGLLAYGLTIYADLPIVEDARFYEEAGYEVARDWLSGREVDFST